MKLGKLKLDKNTWIVIGGAAAAVSAIVLLRNGGGSQAAPAPSGMDLGTTPAGGGGSTSTDLSGLTAAITAQNDNFNNAVSAIVGAIAAQPHPTTAPVAAAPTAAIVPAAAPYPSQPSYASPPQPKPIPGEMIFTPGGQAIPVGQLNTMLYVRPVNDVAPFNSGAVNSRPSYAAAIAPSGTTGRVDSPGGAYIDPGLWSGAQGGGLHGLS